MKMYEVGGCIRDELLGLKTKDIDFAVEVESYEKMVENLEALGFVIYEPRPEYLTARAHVPKGHILLKRAEVADFVVCRKDGPSYDGRRPDYVEAGTIYDDLARRDFTVNAIARDPETDELIDPHNGALDLDLRLLRFVGNPEDRIREDGLRVLRAYRFKVTKNFFFEAATGQALVSDLAVEMLRDISVERIVDELTKMFRFDTFRTLDIISREMPREMTELLIRDKGIRLKPTLKRKF